MELKIRKEVILPLVGVSHRNKRDFEIQAVYYSKERGIVKIHSLLPIFKDNIIKEKTGKKGFLYYMKAIKGMGGELDYIKKGEFDKVNKAILNHILAYNQYLEDEQPEDYHTIVKLFTSTKALIKESITERLTKAGHKPADVQKYTEEFYSTDIKIRLT